MYYIKLATGVETVIEHLDKGKTKFLSILNYEDNHLGYWETNTLGVKQTAFAHNHHPSQGTGDR